MDYSTRRSNAVFFVASNSYAVTPADGTEIGDVYPAFVIFGGAGTVSFQLAGDTANRSMTVAAGQQVDAAFRVINATGTTATNIVAFY